MATNRASHRELFCFLAGLLVLAVGCGGGSGGGSGGGPGEPLPAEAHVVVAPLDLYGEESLLGWSTHKTVLLLHDGQSVEIVDVGEDDVAPSAFGPPIEFSSTGVAWAAGRSADDAWHLLRSDDGARTWQRVDELPVPATSRVLDLHVDALDSGVSTVWIAATVGEISPSAPQVWTRPLDRDAEWRRIDEIPPLGCNLSAVFARRAGNLELLRANASPCFPPGGETAIYTLSDQGVAGIDRIDLPVALFDYATFGDRGWLAGALGTDELSQKPAILTAASGQPWRVHELPGVEGGAFMDVDFSSEENVFACGRTEIVRPLCAFSADGGESWVRSELRVPVGASSITDVVGIGGGLGFAAFRAGDTREGLLETRDDGRSWSSAALPALATTLQIGPLARGVLAVDATAAQARSPVASAGRTSSPRDSGLLGDATPRAWAVGDSARRGPTIMGIVLRSDDGGSTWTETLAVPGGSMAGVAFVDREVGWVVGARKVFRSDDGGASFVDQTDGIPSSHDIHAIHRVVAADRNRAVIVARTAHPAFPGAEHDALFHTVDGGRTWQPSAIGIAAAFPSEERVDGGLCLTSSGMGVMVRSTRVFLTRDAGASWVAGPVFDYVIEGDGFSVSGEGFERPIVACSGDADLWIIVGTRDPRTLDPSTQSLWHSADGGVTWEDLSQRVGRRYDALLPVVGAFTGSGRGWLVGSETLGRASVSGTVDRGATWAELPTPLAQGSDSGFPTVEFPEAIAFASDSDGLMLTTTFTSPRATRHAALATHDGGESWARSALPTDFHPHAVSYVP